MFSIEPGLPQHITFFSDFQFRSIDGLDVTMNCSIILKSENNYTINFEFKSKVVKENDNIIITEFQQGQRVGKILKITRLKKKRDEGKYSCIVTDQFKKTNSITRNLQILNPPMVIFEHVNGSIEVNAGDEIVKLSLNFKTPALPIPIFKITNPRTGVIFYNYSISNKTKYDVKIDKSTIDLTVKHINFDDYGNFTFLATYDEQKYFVNDIKLIVNVKPNIYFVDAFVRDESGPMEISCFVQGYPKANMKWSE